MRSRGSSARVPARCGWPRTGRCAGWPRWPTGRGRCNAMGWRDAGHREMSGFSFPSRPGRGLGEPLLDALLDGRALAPDAPEGARVVAEMLAELAGPAEPGEPAGEAARRCGFASSGAP